MLCNSKSINKKPSSSILNNEEFRYENNNEIPNSLQISESDIFLLQQKTYEFKTLEESTKLNLYMNHDIINLLKERLKYITEVNDINSQVFNTFASFEKIHLLIKTCISNIKSECILLSSEINELKEEVEGNCENDKKVIEYENKLFINQYKIASLEDNLKEIDDNIKVNKRNKNSILAILMFRDKTNLHKVLETEVEIIRENTTRLTKTINYYKNKSKDADKVIQQMDLELKNINERKIFQIIPKIKSEYSSNDKVNISSTSIANFNSNKTKLKELLEKYKSDLKEIQNENDEYKLLNDKFEEENKNKKLILLNKQKEINLIKKNQIK